MTKQSRFSPPQGETLKWTWHWWLVTVRWEGVIFFLCHMGTMVRFSMLELSSKRQATKTCGTGGVLKFQSTICTGLSSTIVWRGLNRRWNSSSSQFCWFFCVSQRYHGSETSSANWKDSWQTEKTGFLEWRYGKMGGFKYQDYQVSYFNHT